MGCKQILCKHYDKVKDGKCEFEGTECVNRSMYQSMYAKVNCVHYCQNLNGKCYCDVLQGKYRADAPCGNPRMNKEGKPVKCTFYETEEEYRQRLKKQAAVTAAKCL